MSDTSRLVVVGAGPTGLSAAVLLRQRGFDPIVLDRRPSLGTLPAAHVANTRTIEIFDTMGIADVVSREGDLSAMSSLVAWVESMAGREYGILPIAMPKRDERGPVSAFTAVNIPQTELEPILLQRLVDLGGIVRFGIEVADVEIRGDRARLTTRSSSGGGDPEYLDCDWIIGCDGAGSVVRRSVGIEMVGPRTIARFMTIYFHADLDRYREGRKGVLYWIGGRDARGVFISFDAIGRRWAMLVPIGDLPLETFDDDAARAIVHKAIGSQDVEVTLQGLSSWNMSAQVADMFRKGPVLLAGDACHRFPPTGGLGMNTGIQDVHNLVWKLAAVIEGNADPGLLDSYERERKPIAQRNTDQSVGNLMKMSMIDDALGIQTLAPITADAGRGPVVAYPSDVLQIDGDSADAVARRALVQEAIDEQFEHFAQGSGLDLGYSYAEGAFVPDGSAPPSSAPCHYRPDAHPGARLPYAAVGIDGSIGSTLRLVSPTGITMFASDRRWSDVAAQAMERTGVGIKTLVVGHDFTDEDGLVAELFGIAGGGAVAVRPDHFVLCRIPAWSDDAGAQLLRATLISHGFDYAGAAVADPYPPRSNRAIGVQALAR